MLTPEGKKQALAQLAVTAKEAKVNVKNAKDKLAEVTKAKTDGTKTYMKAQKALDASITKAQKEVSRAEARAEIAVKAVAELKGTEVTKPTAPLARPTVPAIQPLITAAPATQQ